MCTGGASSVARRERHILSRVELRGDTEDSSPPPLRECCALRCAPRASRRARCAPTRTIIVLACVEELKQPVLSYVGHDHSGGYHLDKAGLHHVTFSSPLECEIGTYVAPPGVGPDCCHGLSFQSVLVATHPVYVCVRLLRASCSRMAAALFCLSVNGLCGVHAFHAWLCVRMGDLLSRA